MCECESVYVSVFVYVFIYLFKFLGSMVIILLLEEKLLFTEAAPELLKDISSKVKEPWNWNFP